MKTNRWNRNLVISLSFLGVLFLWGCVPTVPQIKLDTTIKNSGRVEIGGAEAPVIINIDSLDTIQSINVHPSSASDAQGKDTGVVCKPKEPGPTSKIWGCAATTEAKNGDTVSIVVEVKSSGKNATLDYASLYIVMASTPTAVLPPATATIPPVTQTIPPATATVPLPTELAPATEAAAASPDQAIRTLPISGNFIPSGYMGTIEDISLVEGDTITVSYSMTSSNGWAGVYWLNPANNWGTVEKAGYDLSWAKKLVFSVRGTPGAQVEFFTGGVQKGNYPSSLGKNSVGFITLQDGWQEITIPLDKANLSYVIDGFGWVSSRAKNRGMPAEGIKFDLKDIHFE